MKDSVWLSVRQSVHTNLVATASPGKWRLLNTRAKAPSYNTEKKQREKRIQLSLMKEFSPINDEETKGEEKG